MFFRKYKIKTDLSYDEVIARLKAITHLKTSRAGEYNGEFHQDHYRLERVRNWLIEGYSYGTVIAMWVLPEDSGQCELFVKIKLSLLGAITLVLNILLISPFMFLGLALLFSSKRGDVPEIIIYLPLTLSIMMVLIVFSYLKYCLDKDKQFLGQLLK